MCNECTLHSSARMSIRTNIDHLYHCRTHPCYLYLDQDGIPLYYQYKINGTLHREDGPAMLDAGYRIWYINGIRFKATSQEEFEIEYREWKIRAFK